MKTKLFAALCVLGFCVRTWSQTACGSHNPGIRLTVIDVDPPGGAALCCNFTIGAPAAGCNSPVLPGNTIQPTDGASGSNYYLTWNNGANVAGPFVGGTLATGFQCYTIAVSSNGVPTNCTAHFTITNPDSVQHTYQILYNGVPDGTVTVFGGSSQTVSLPDPNCNPGLFSYYPIPNFWSLEPPGYNPGNPGVPPDSDNPPKALGAASTAGGTGTNSPNNLGTGPYPLAGFTNNPLTANTNGPINFGTNGAESPTNTLVNGTLQQVGNALYTANVQSEQAIVDAIHAMDNANRAGHAGTSNLLQTATNELGVITNELGQLLNGGSFTNAGSQAWSNSFAALTNGASGLASSITNAFGTGAGALNTNVTWGSSGDTYTIALPTGPSPAIIAPTLRISLSDVQAIQSLAPFRSVAAWVVLVCTFYAMCQQSEQVIFRLMNQRQGQGNKQQIEGLTFGGNADVASALVYGVIIAAVIASVPVALFAFSAGTASQANNLMGSLTTISSSPAWHLVTAAVPVDVIVAAFFSYFVFRFLVADILTMAAAAIIIFLFE